MNTVKRWLRERSLQSPDIDARLRAVEKLASSADPQAVELLIQALHDPDAPVRAHAASGLRMLRDGRAAAQLVALVLREREMTVLHEAADALAAIAHPRTAAMLIKGLDDADVSVRQAAAWGLRKLCWDQLSDATKARVAIVRSEWSQVADFGPAAIEPLLGAFASGTQRVRSEAADALAQIGTADAVGALVSQLRDFTLDPAARQTVARALRRFCRDDLTDEQHALVCIALGEWSDVVSLGPAAVGPLVSALPHSSLSAPAARALARIGPAGVDSLADLGKDRDQPGVVREAAAMALAEIADARAIEPLIQMLDDRDMAVRQAVVWALERLGWKPADDSQRVLLAVAHDDWEQVHQLGAAAVDPLLCLASSAMALEHCVPALERILQEHPNDLSVTQLRKIAALKASRRQNAAHLPLPGERPEPRGDADCARVRNLGRAELRRRGVLC